MKRRADSCPWKQWVWINLLNPIRRAKMVVCFDIMKKRYLP